MRGHASISSGFPHDDGDQHRSRLRSVPLNVWDSGRRFITAPPNGGCPCLVRAIASCGRRLGEAGRKDQRKRVDVWCTN